MKDQRTELMEIAAVFAFSHVDWNSCLVHPLRFNILDLQKDTQAIILSYYSMLLDTPLEVVDGSTALYKVLAESSYPYLLPIS